MKKEKRVAIHGEFPFLGEVAELTQFNWESGFVRIKRLDAEFLLSVPVEHHFRGSIGTASRVPRLFTVAGTGVREIQITPDCTDESAYAYEPTISRDGQRYITSLIDEGVQERAIDYLVLHRKETCSWDESRDEESITVLKLSRTPIFESVWAGLLADAKQAVQQEADV